MHGRGMVRHGMGMGPRVPGMGPGMGPRHHGWGMHPHWMRLLMGPMWPGMMWPSMMLMMGAFTILLYGNRPIKLRKTDVRVIETDTGKSVEDLTEEELIDALKRLEIEKMELSEDDYAQIKSAKNSK